MEPRSLAAVLALLAAVWWSGPWGTTGERVEEYARLAELGRAQDPLAALAAWWLAFAADPVRLQAAVVVLLLCCIAAAAFAGYALARSPWVALGVALIALASPFPGAWIDRPLGGADAITVLAMIAVLGGALIDQRRARAAEIAGAAVAVAVSGWALVAVVPFILVARGPHALRLLGVTVAALAVRALIGVKPARLAGAWDPAAPHAVEAVRLTVLMLAAIPAVAFVLTRPSVAERLRSGYARLGGPRRLAVAAAALGLGIAAGLLDGGAHGAALYVAELAAALLAAAILADAGSAVALRAAAAVGAGVVLIGAAHRLDRHTADDEARVANDRRIVASAARAPSFILVEPPGLRDSVRYAPAVLAYYAGHDVRVAYAPSIPARSQMPVLLATPDGLNRVDGTAAELRRLADARRTVVADLAARAGQGQINDRTPVGTPSGLGVVPDFALPGIEGQLRTITVVSGFSWTLERVPVTPGSRLVYAEAKVLAAGDDVRATVRVELPGRAPIVAADDLPPGPPGGPRSWRFRSVALPVRRPGLARVVFAASSPNGDAVGDWAAFAEPAIVAGPPR